MLLTYDVAEKIKEARKKGLKKVKVSLDLNKSEQYIDPWSIPEGVLDKIKVGWVYYFDGEEFFRVAIRTTHLFKLLPTKGAPTFEIDGVRMHIMKDIRPENVSKGIMALLNPHGKLLDICTGLGYTAIEASKYCDEVHTIEKYQEVIELAKMNPWSKGLFSKKITIHIGDAFQVIDRFDDGYFDFVVHDPPSFPLAPNLYSKSFYQKIWRVMKKGGRIYHYVGEPGSKRRGRDLMKGCMQRIREVGFRIIRKRVLKGFIAEKI